MTTPSPAEQLHEALKPLGDTADEIAHALDSGGYKGVWLSGTDCPLARFLAAKFGKNVWNVTGSHVRYEPTGEYIELPQPFQEFTLRFDNGRYPFLRGRNPFRDSANTGN